MRPENTRKQQVQGRAGPGCRREARSQLDHNLTILCFPGSPRYTQRPPRQPSQGVPSLVMVSNVHLLANSGGPNSKQLQYPPAFETCVLLHCVVCGFIEANAPRVGLGASAKSLDSNVHHLHEFHVLLEIELFEWFCLHLQY